MVERLVVCRNPLLTEERARKRTELLAATEAELMQDLATLAYNVTHTTLNPNAKIVLTARPTPLQEKAFQLLGVTPARTQ
ncbi:hypothetical protein [Aromatoleum anaerobium]|uniref:Uncharacterized protein n=1 Tax=Aromatoleum anaerobium TaxID=182180 RepID=A0ABX1PJ73_9RHOO|nr:hypothetical protein [Aromatoleum anaerobium]MCK0506631.1 hypothetical protein [Aromatoleum anaerobium]